MFFRNNSNKIRLGLMLVVLLLAVVVAGGFFVLSFSSWGRVVLALSGNYSKTVGPPNNQLNDGEWNNLPNEFLDKSGDTISGNLDMNSNRIANIPTAPTAATDAVNARYVINSLVGSIGSEMFVNWGSFSCPASWTELHEGYIYGSRIYNYSGGDNPICLNDGDAGTFFSGGNQADIIMPIKSGGQATIPSDILEGKFFHCAICYKSDSTCYTNFGKWTCGASGFFPVYEGYVLGSTAYRENSGERICVNRNSAGLDTTSITHIIGSSIEDNFGQSGYNMDQFIRCAVCCN